MRKKFTLRKLTVKAILASLAVPALLSLPSQGWADAGLGTRVPLPTAANQIVYSGSTAPFSWQPVTLPYLSNGSGQMAVGGAVDTGSRLSVAPSGTAENGVSVKMPSGATGDAFQVKNSVGNTIAQISVSGTTTIHGLLEFSGGDGSNPGFHFLNVAQTYNFGGNLGLGLDPSYKMVASTYGFAVETNGATEMLCTPNGAVSAAQSVSAPTINATSTYQEGGIAGYTGTIPTTAQSLNFHGGICTGFIDSSGTQVGNP